MKHRRRNLYAEKTETTRQFKAGQMLTVARIYRTRDDNGTACRKRIVELRFDYRGNPVKTPLLRLRGLDGWWKVTTWQDGESMLTRAYFFDGDPEHNPALKRLAYLLHPEGTS